MWQAVRCNGSKQSCGEVDEDRELTWRGTLPNHANANARRKVSPSIVSSRLRAGRNGKSAAVLSDFRLPAALWCRSTAWRGYIPWLVSGDIAMLRCIKSWLDRGASDRFLNNESDLAQTEDSEAACEVVPSGDTVSLRRLDLVRGIMPKRPS